MALGTLSRALIIGAVLVIEVLFAFLRDWRAALIRLTAIPLSLLTAGLVIHYSGGLVDTTVGVATSESTTEMDKAQITAMASGFNMSAAEPTP